MCLNPYLTIKVNNVVLSLKDLARMKRNSGMSIYEMTESKNIVEINCGKCAECLKKKIYRTKTKNKKRIQKKQTMLFYNIDIRRKTQKKTKQKRLSTICKKIQKKTQNAIFLCGRVRRDNTKRTLPRNNI